MTELTATPGQTIGPFFGYALPFDRGNELVPPDSAGAIALHGIVTDGAGAPVPDALVEIWQADSSGSVPTSSSLRRDSDIFTGWGRAATDADGHYSFTTVKPGALQRSTPFIAVAIFARGLLNRLFTRAYFPGDQLETDPLLNSVAADRRHTLITVPDEHGFRFDIRLQGADETVFLRYRGQP
ncbi:protocatechuate 3,4-dioxygenase subunit alpha [Mycolicibacter arupensis]|jgi:protocatechuate 3,4-dioxygenase alpha subunit|uniref:Protocatechuate 3,4-dioxygenase subunit alpha n=1 Tax=Mycolicibacter arupensis TaxID=342002 RepID=A0A5C7YAX6_9MYCO|nr:protocatechuate 3,4-dioxygenase subunit alpha [Mycolicibacter arupensis]TXI58727.1 MAG: protocatechuate 3,4-dioxygenase subunit alpha [Mycolicibacter arupensis]